MISGNQFFYAFFIQAVDALRKLIIAVLHGLVPGPDYTAAANGIIKLETALAKVC